MSPFRVNTETLTTYQEIEDLDGFTTTPNTQNQHICIPYSGKPNLKLLSIIHSFFARIHSTALLRDVYWKNPDDEFEFPTDKKIANNKFAMPMKCIVFICRNVSPRYSLRFEECVVFNYEVSDIVMRLFEVC